MNLRDLIPNIAETARTLGLSYKTVFTWVKNNKVPPRRVIPLANALDVELFTLMQFAERAPSNAQTLIKASSELEEINSHYLNGTTPESNSHRAVLTAWGDRWPLLYQTLHRLTAREITAAQAAKILEITPTAIHNIRRRYGLNPGRTAPKIQTKRAPRAKPKKKDLNLEHALDAIAGRVTAKEAAERATASLRSMHRYIAGLIEPRTLNELSHWSPNFRVAFTLEVTGKSPKVVEKWRKVAENRGLLLKKRPIPPKPVENWRGAPLWRLTVAALTGEADIPVIAASRGGSAPVIDGLVTKYLHDLDLECRNLSVHHQAAAAEIIVAMQSHYRSIVATSPEQPQQPQIPKEGTNAPQET